MDTQIKKRVVVAMSGGVDSSVAAALLRSQGYDVVGMMLRLWSEPGAQDSNRCCTPEAMGLARKVAGRLGIPFYAVDVQERFFDLIVDKFIQGYDAGITPNPCLTCNRHVRFGLLLEQARSIGADYLATGHYAVVRKDEEGTCHLHRSTDIAKDQSYVLHVLTQDQLRHALFPLGNLKKSEVRQLAGEYGLPVAERRDSQDLCFLAGDDYRNFLNRNAPHVFQPGEIHDHCGKVIGNHNGLANYTIGQRKGLGISSPVPLYVTSKNAATNTLVVGDLSELGNNFCVAEDVNWVRGCAPERPFSAFIKIRYRAKEAAGNVLPDGTNRVTIKFDEDLRDITPGQAAVFYVEDEVLGGGVIASAGEDKS
jgi:tRNA-uridine 2-sulfurtransferase